METTTIEKLKKGDLFKIMRFANAKPSVQVYVFDGYNRSTKKYSAYKFEDICSFRDFNKAYTITTDFIF